MRNVVWIALAFAAFAFVHCPVRADAPATLPDPAPPAPLPEPLPPIPPAPGTTDAPPAPEGSPPADAEFVATPGPEAGTDNCSTGTPGRCRKCGNQAICDAYGNCSECGRRQTKVGRILDWLFYSAEDHGKTQGYQISLSAPPPAWAAFPVQGGGRCTTCVASSAAACTAKPPALYIARPPAAYVAKPPAAPVSNTVKLNAYQLPIAQQPSTQTAAQPVILPARVSTFVPQSVAPNMPVLDPSQFRRQPGN
jgi:hypothetical protein